MNFDSFASLMGEETAAYLVGFNLAEKPEHILGYLERLDMELYGYFSENIPAPHSPLYQKWERRALELDRLNDYDESDLEATLKHIEYILENWNK